MLSFGCQHCSFFIVLFPLDCLFFNVAWGRDNLEFNQHLVLHCIILLSFLLFFSFEICCCALMFRLLVECFTKYCVVREAIRHFRALKTFEGGTKALHNEGNFGDPLSLYLRALCREGIQYTHVSLILLNKSNLISSHSE